ncbi:hypothetical protein BDR26DRAFT_869694 [Obelidium mucronatum]|nr:hypothetical protein BDR26DRAFT_869694 [Obelidium mucronatum]
MDQKLYYFLTNEQGEPYEGTSGNILTISTDSMVAEFTDCMFGMKNKLGGVDASDLKVFKRREDVFDSTKALEFDDSVSGLGDGRAAALIVVVPTPKNSTQAHSKDCAPASEFNELKGAVAKFLEKAISIQFSQMSFSILKEDGFTTKARILAEPDRNQFCIPDFDWPIPKNEKAVENKTAYLKHFREFLVPIDTRGTLFVDLAPDKNFLDVNLKHHWRGGSDIMVVPTGSQMLLAELKPNKLTRGDYAQAIAEIAAASLLFEDQGYPTPVGVLTDLKDQWVLLWVHGTDGCIHFADTELVSTARAETLPVFYLQKHLNKLIDLLNSAWTGGDEPEGFGTRVGKLEIAQTAGVEDPMTDMFDEMTLEEVNEYKIKRKLLAIEHSSFMTLFPSNEPDK